jgi:hypothetical protein
MRVALAVVLILVAYGVYLLVGWLRYRAKIRRMDRFYWEVQNSIRDAGFEPLGEGWLKKEQKAVRFTLHPNPLFRKGYTVRIGAFSDTLHEFELRRGRPVPPEFASFSPLLERWESCGKHDIECWAAKVTERGDVGPDAAKLWELARRPLSREHRGGTITFREGFESDCPQNHWRHDLRAKLPKNVRRFCVSYWQDGPLLTPPLARFLYDLAGESRKFVLSDTDDLRFLEYSFERRDIACWGALLELGKPELLAAADQHTDGGFFGGFFAARELPPGFEEEGGIPKFRFHEAALKVYRKCDFYARRLFDDENSWFSGEYEILTAYPIDVRGAVARMAQSLGAQVLEIDRRFHKRLVKPLDW